MSWSFWLTHCIRKSEGKNNTLPCSKRWIHVDRWWVMEILQQDFSFILDANQRMLNTEIVFIV